MRALIDKKSADSLVCIPRHREAALMAGKSSFGRAECLVLFQGADRLA